VGRRSPSSASKHALEGWLESLQNEVAEFGVRVHLIEPGFIRTDLAAAEPVPQPACPGMTAFANASSATGTSPFMPGCRPKPSRAAWWT
jgi:NAD(P)-dependent dehydrogenase (short-subunit alcohol dehydrogenase family)